MGPPPGSTACDPDVAIASPTEFVLKNKVKDQNFIWGELSPTGELEFVVENLPKDRTGCPGWWLFERMMAHFGAAVVAIRGSWTYGDNLSAVNRLTAGGALTLPEAATHGPTGRYALAHGFGSIRLVAEVGAPGSYTRVVVLFTR